MEPGKEYYAFISYKREDEKWAKWFQKKLEYYKLPIEIIRTRPELPQFLRPIFKDTTDLNGDTLYGSIKELIEHIYTLKPNVKLVFITQPFKSHTNGLIVNSAGMKITDIPIAVKEVCNLYGVPVFDYYNLCEINNITKSQYISADNLHPTATLQEKFGIALNNFIENLYI